MIYRPPRAPDAAPIWRLAPQRGGPHHDTGYAYLLLCTHFADTGVVAELDGAVVGFALAYRPPIRPHDTFVSHLGVADGHDKAELAARLLDQLVSRQACRDSQFLCMTCNLRDLPLQTWFRQFARRRSTRCAIEPCFTSTMFPQPHPDEHLLRVGPLLG